VPCWAKPEKLQMSEDFDMRHLLEELHAARVQGDLARLCVLFADDASFRISGTSDGKPIAVAASGLPAIRSWLSMLVKTFKLSGYKVCARIIEEPNAAVHWQVGIHSRITGVVSQTELVDLVTVRGGLIVSYTEFFAPL
jgi:ketosteroid isomerase-like protein